MSAWSEGKRVPCVEYLGLVDSGGPALRRARRMQHLKLILRDAVGKAVAFVLRKPQGGRPS